MSSVFPVSAAFHNYSSNEIALVFILPLLSVVNFGEFIAVLLVSSTLVWILSVFSLVV